MRRRRVEGFSKFARESGSLCWPGRSVAVTVPLLRKHRKGPWRLAKLVRRSDPIFLFPAPAGTTDEKVSGCRRDFSRLGAADHLLSALCESLAGSVRKPPPAGFQTSGVSYWRGIDAEAVSTGRVVGDQCSRGPWSARAREAIQGGLAREVTPGSTPAMRFLSKTSSPVRSRGSVPARGCLLLKNCWYKPASGRSRWQSDAR